MLNGLLTSPDAFKTAIELVPAVTKSAVDICATNWLELEYVVGFGIPFHRTID